LAARFHGNNVLTVISYAPHQSGVLLKLHPAVFLAALVEKQKRIGLLAAFEVVLKNVESALTWQGFWTESQLLFAELLYHCL